MVDGPVSRIEWVEGKLRDAILDGDLAPGERLLTAQLAERFSVSPTPLREALHRFAGEGLVEFLAQKGARVAPLTPEECTELAELRSLLDPLAARRSVDARDDDWGDRIADASSDLVGAWQAAEHDPRRSEQIYRNFYKALTSTCPSQRLKRYAGNIRDQQARYRIATITFLDRDALTTRHGRMLKAARAGDGQHVAELVADEVQAFSRHFVDTYDRGEPERG